MKKWSLSKALKRIVVAILILVVACGLSFGTFKLFQNYQSKELRETFFRASPDEADVLFSISDSEDLIFDKEAYNIYEVACLGNSNRNLLATGFYAKKGNTVCASGSNTTALVDDKELKISDNPSSYINIINNNVFYRDDTDRKIYRYSLENGKTECFVNAACGETVVCVKGVYYVDYKDKKLNFLAFDESESKQLYDNRISSFAVVGNGIFILTDDNVFGFLKEGDSFIQITTEVERFFFDSSAYIQKGTKIYRIDSFTQSECMMEKTSGVLLFADRGCLYIAENDSVTKVLDNGTTEKIYSLKENEIVKSLIETDTTYEVSLFTSKNGMLTEKKESIKK